VRVALKFTDLDSVEDEANFETWQRYMHEEHRFSSSESEEDIREHLNDMKDMYTTLEIPSHHPLKKNRLGIDKENLVVLEDIYMKKVKAME